ncbi:MAG: ABC transporter permease [Actinobacteria bacterium]|nr:ABC transporter permease [Actinomycetota bacterium]
MSETTATNSAETAASLAPIVDGSPPTAHKSRLYWAFDDAKTVAWRNLLKYVRVPQLIVFSTIQPIMFVLLFRYVFGGAINTGPIPYVDYLMPGIFVQTVLFGATSTGIGLAEDANTGLLERFRSLPMARSAVLTGRTLADVVRNFLVVILMVVVGYLVGFRFHGTIAESTLAILLVVLFGYAFSWVAALIGLRASTPEAAQAATFPVLFPLVFASSAFVPTATMPTWLQAFANNQPVSIVINASRQLVLGGYIEDNRLYVGVNWFDVGLAVLWMIGITAVFAPLAVRAYRKKVS